LLARAVHNLTRTISPRHFFKFSFAGLLNTLFGYAVIFSLYYLGVSESLSSFSGYAAGLVLSFFFSKKFVFEARGNNFVFALRFLAAFLVSFLVNLIILKIFLYAGFNFYVSQIIASGGYFVVFFFLSKNWVFARGDS